MSDRKSNEKNHFDKKDPPLIIVFFESLLLQLNFPEVLLNISGGYVLIGWNSFSAEM